ncbi:pantetheine-phosphate adenylyltransferase [Alicyclobacillus fodiniaquatilis]|jgi:pantetheine-phosphate adenylyltransferase|uniref:Phosphopantetheine adenylyltransferase n=1 Tax=Alicyclobacillus fodiniaquatilis TaxID=1661150 RepID=A0ABW4JN14_9BACL
MRRAVYPGSFDPITLGHLDILQHAAALFDEVVVAVLHNPLKQPLFTVEERLEHVTLATSAYANVRTEAFAGLLVDYCREKQIDVVVRGLRNASDLQSEMPMAQMNQTLHSQIHTVFVPSAPAFSFVSSSLVKDVAMHGGDVSQFVPKHVLNALHHRLS